jgi:hypothetical protein
LKQAGRTRVTLVQGTLLLLSNGEYSDDMRLGVYQVLQDFDPDAILETYLKAAAAQQEPTAGHFPRFVTHLIALGMIEPLPMPERREEE